MRIFSLILLFSISVLAQLKPFTFTSGSVTSLNDTTNNYYVSTTGTDTSSTGSYTNPFSIAKADTFFNYENKDTVFFLSGTYDTTFTARHAGVTYCAYDLNNKPIFLGADTVRNWNFANVASAEYDTNKVDLTNTTTYEINQSYAVAWSVPTTVHGYLYGYMLRMGANSVNGKFALGTRSGGVITLTDSSSVGATTLTASALNTILYGDNGEYISQDSIWVVASFSNTANIPYGTSSGTKLSFFQSGWTSGAYTNFPQSQYSILDGDADGFLNSRIDYAMGIIVKSTINQGDTSKFYVIYPDTIYQLFYSQVLGRFVEHKDSVNSVGDWFRGADDSLWVYEDTTLIEVTVRDGITIADSNVIAGFDIRKTRYGVFNNTTNDVQIGQSIFKQNQYGILDTGASVGYYRNNIFNNNYTNLQAENKDTVKIYNNTFKHEFGTDSLLNNIYLADSRVKFKNNAVYTGLPKVGTTVNCTIDAKDYNGYAYYKKATTHGKYWDINGVRYDSLAQEVAATAFEDSSFDVYNDEAYPFNDLWFVSIGEDFRLRNDSIVSPLLNKGVDVNLHKDFYGNPIPDSRQDIGAIEMVLIDNPPSSPTNLTVIMQGDSAKLSFSYTYEVDLDSVREFVNSSWNNSVAFSPIVYHHPIRSGSSSLPSITQLNVTNVGTTTAQLNFYIHPNNDTTYVRARYGIGSFTDSTVSIIKFIFIPQATNYYIRLVDTSGQVSGISNIAALTWNDSIYVSISLTGLTNSQTYMADITGLHLNDNEWINSSDASFTTGGTEATSFYITNDATDDLDATDDTLTYATLQSGYILPRGKSIAFEKGKTYNGSWSLLRDTCTVEAGRDTIKSYGTGLKPIITTKTTLPSLSWADVNGAFAVNGNPVRDTVWVATFPATGDVGKAMRLWLDGTEAFLGNALNYTDPDGVPAYSNQDGTYFVNAIHKFCYYPSQRKLYIYVAGDQSPTSQYTTIEFSGQMTTAGVTGYSVVELKDADYITFDGIDFQGGAEYTIGLGGADYITFENCNIGLGAAVGGINGQSYYVNSVDRSCDYITLNKDTINSGYPYGWRLHSSYSWFVSPYGILPNGAEGYARYWTIDSCFIKDWELGILAGGLSTSNHHTISNNHINGGNRDYMKAFQFNGADNIDFYNNWIDSCNIHSQLNPNVDGGTDGSDSNKIYFNIFSDARQDFNLHDTHYDWLAIQRGIGNYIFNNTVVGMYDRNMDVDWEGDDNKFYNNLFVNTGQEQIGVYQVHLSQISALIFKNNLFSANYLSSSTDIVWKNNPAPQQYTLSELNAIGGNISGNLLHTGLKNTIINDNFTLPVGSPALNAGIDVDALLPALFEDRNGNLVDQTNPDDGAIQSP